MIHVPGTKPPEPKNWKQPIYAMGAGLGTLFGLVAAYMYTRAAEEDVTTVGRAERVSTGDVLGLGLAGLAIIRQITELGHGPKTSKKK
jgi:hypothetical protein